MPIKLYLAPLLLRGGMFPFLAALTDADAHHSVELDFTDIRHINPGPLAALTAVIRRWKRSGKEVKLSGLGHCPVTAYLIRMDFFSAIEEPIEHHFISDPTLGNFVEITEIQQDTSALGSKVATCLAPGGHDPDDPISELWDLVWYVITETANNVRQHGKGEGFVAGQKKTSEGLTRISLADSGMGILGSFKEARFPWADEMDDATAILKALEPKVSSKGGPINAGVGLTLVTGMVKLLGGWLTIVSGDGCYMIGPKAKFARAGNMPRGARYPGTLILMAFRSEEVKDHAKLLNDAKIAAGLLNPQEIYGRFSP